MGLAGAHILGNDRFSLLGVLKENGKIKNLHNPFLHDCYKRPRNYASAPHLCRHQAEAFHRREEVVATKTEEDATV